MLLFDTTIGACGVRWSELGVTDVFLPRSGALRGPYSEDPQAAPEAVRLAVEEMVALLDGEHCDLRNIALDEQGIDAFRRSVYAATRAIDPGVTATYGDIARTIGEPGAARAVGTALGRNPFPIIVPCHRVIAADGALTGFSSPGGIATKRRMLEIEHAPGFRQAALFT